MRRWAVELFRSHQPTWGPPDALALTALLHMGDDLDRFSRARELTQARTILFLDEPSWERAALDVFHAETHFIHDPHREGQVYEGFWGQTGDGVVIGKAPQHPTMHNLYRAADMTSFLGAAPLPDGV